MKSTTGVEEAYRGRNNGARRAKASFRRTNFLGLKLWARFGYLQSLILMLLVCSVSFTTFIYIDEDTEYFLHVAQTTDQIGTGAMHTVLAGAPP